MEKFYVPTVMKLLNDKIVNIRRNGYKSLLNLTEFQEGIYYINLRNWSCLSIKYFSHFSE
jgi:hypothetical protein